MRFQSVILALALVVLPGAALADEAASAKEGFKEANKGMIKVFKSVDKQAKKDLKTIDKSAKETWKKAGQDIKKTTND